MNNSSERKEKIIFLILDIVCLIFSFTLAYFIRHGNLQLFSIEGYRELLFVMILINIILALILNPFADILYKSNFEEIKSTLLFDAISFFLAILYLFIMQSSSSFSRITLFLTYIFYFVLSLVLKILAKTIIKNKYDDLINKKSLFVLCKLNEIDKIKELSTKNDYSEYKISAIGLIDSNNSKDIKKEKIKFIQKNDILKYVSTNWVDEILIFSNYKSISKRIMKGLKITGIPIHMKIDEIDLLDDRKQYINNIYGYDVISLVINQRSFFDVIIKRFFDIIGGLIGCIVAIIIAIIIGPIIYAKSPGNILYISERVGKNGKIFKFYKFRSMVLNADELKLELKENNKIKDNMMFKIDNDPRIIPGIGEFIRKTSLDEFPQFFNVLKGDMSLVGTRPPTVDEWNRYSPYYRSRLSIKPGITGLWQVSGRSNITDFNEVVKLDNMYINNWSLWLDIKILAKTIFVVFKKEGSY